jgi:phosphate:Na+ symporter
MYHLMFNLIGAAFWLAVFLIWKHIASPAFLSDLATPLGIAIVHTTYKLLCSALILPFNGAMERLICRIVPDTAGPEKKVELDERLLKAPALALQQCRVLMDDMAKAALDSINDSLGCMDSYTGDLDKSIRANEDLTDHYEDIIGTYLVKLSSQKLSEDDNMTSAEFLKLITDFERIADHSVTILDAVLEKADKKIVFSEGAVGELNVLVRAIRHITLLSYNAFVNKDIDSAFKVEPLEQVVDYLKEEIRTRHIRRLQRGECSIEAGFVLNDLLTAMERVSDHCSNIAGCIIDSSMHNLNLHETLNEYKHNSTKFNSSYDGFMKQYALPLMEEKS